MRSSPAAFDLIIREEVSSQATYEKLYRRPEWPGEASGPTVGIGYDLGQTDVATIRADWRGRVSEAMLLEMLACSGRTGAAGQVRTRECRSLIDVPWNIALAVHKERVIPRWESRLAANLPNTDKLSGDCFGALLSLIFNRGTSFGKDGDRYKEMRAIKAHMATSAFDRIPAELRSMKRLWPNSKGLRDRRDREAALFERGLKPAGVKTETATAGTVVIGGGAAATQAKKSGATGFEIALMIGATLALAVLAVVLIRKVKGK